MTLTAISPEILRLRAKARHEIGEKEESQVQSQVIALRNHIASENACSLPPKSYDCFLLKCLRARKYDLDRAAKTYKKYCQLKQRSDEITEYMVPSEYNSLFKSKFVGLLNKRDHLGRHIMLIQVQKWNPSKADLDEVLASLFMMVDQATDSTDTQYNGIVVIADFKGFGFSHAKQVSPSRVQCIVNIVQDSYPARFKEFHFLNHPALFNMAFALAKPFLKEKIRKRIFFHGHDLSSLQKSVNTSLLPNFLGGSVPDNECHDEDALNQLLKKDDYYEGMRQNFNLIETCQDYDQ